LLRSPVLAIFAIMLSPDADLWADALAVRLRGNRGLRGSDPPELLGEIGGRSEAAPGIEGEDLR
jgi:hypothetical protein